MIIYNGRQLRSYLYSKSPLSIRYDLWDGGGAIVMLHPIFDISDFWLIWWIKYYNIQEGEEIKERKLLCQTNPKILRVSVKSADGTNCELFVDCDEFERAWNWEIMLREDFYQMYPDARPHKGEIRITLDETDKDINGFKIKR